MTDSAYLQRFAGLIRILRASCQVRTRIRCGRRGAPTLPSWRC